MTEITAYKSIRGKLFENKKDAIKDDIEQNIITLLKPQINTFNNEYNSTKNDIVYLNEAIKEIQEHPNEFIKFVTDLEKIKNDELPF